MVTSRIYFLFGALLLIAWGCGSSSDELTKAPPVGSADQLYTQAQKAYSTQDYPEAIRLFEEVRVQAPASTIAAEATYLEAMSRYNQDLFAGSAVDFRAVRRNYPNSPYAIRAQYMVGESYYQISPRPELDQSYTILALSEFQNFLHNYPAAPPTLTDSAQKRIVEIRTRLATKYFLDAQLYDKLETPKSAAVYYQRVLDNYYDTPPAIESELRLAEINVARKQFDDARKDLDAFDTKYLATATTDERQRALKLHAALDKTP